MPKLAENLSSLVKASSLFDNAVEFLEKNKAVAEGLQKLGLTVQDIAPIMKEVATFGTQVLGNSLAIAEVLRKNQELYKNIVEVLLAKPQYGLTQLLELTPEQMFQIASDGLEIVRKVNLRGFLETQKENILQVVNKAASSQLENNEAIQGFMRTTGLEKEVVGDLISDALPIVFDISTLVLKDENLQTIHEDIVKKLPTLMSETASDQEKTETLFEVLDKTVELLSQEEARQMYTDQIVPFLEGHEETLGKAIESAIEQSPLRGRVKIDGKRLVDLASNPETLKVLYGIYQDWKGGEKSKGKIAIKAMWRASKEFRATIWSGIKNLVFQEFMMPSFVRRHYIGNTINQVIQEGIQSPIEGERKSLSEIFQKAAVAQNDRGSIADYSLKANFCEGLKFSDVSFKNLDIVWFNFKKAMFNREGVSFENSMVQGTIFEKAEFKAVASFKGAIIENTKFKNVKFKEGIDLSNATIDKKSLKSLLPSLDKTMVEGKEIKTEGLKLSSLNLSKEEGAEFEKSAFGKQYLATIEENSKTIEEDKKVLILMKQVRSHFKEEEGIDENLFKLAERNVRQAVRLEVVKGEEEFKKISHPTVFANLLRKFGHFDKSN